MTSFVGRRHELNRLRALLSERRLVTITGPGGAGKTRLAEELAATITRSLEAGAAIAYLAKAHAPVEVGEVAAAAVGLRNRGPRAGAAELIDYLGDHRLLLVLDNCEHLAAASAALVAELLGACPGVTVVATGRQPLHVPGEQLFPIGGLLPEVASELFADRARLAVPDFEPDEASRALIKEICVRLEGMPLAIELAAAQVRSLGLADLSRRLEGHLADLASRSTVGPERQRTIRQAIAWSHDLLSDAQRVAWRRLSIFSGGFTLEAAERVAGDGPIEPADVAGLLTDLVDQSMLIFEPDAGRYRLLEALREFARERLAEAGEAVPVAERHRRWMVDLAVDTDRRWFGPDQPLLVERMSAEAGNLRVALENCRASGAGSDGLRLANGALWYWLVRTSLQDGLRWYDVFLGRSGDPALEAQAHWRAAYLAVFRMDFASADALFREALAYAEAADSALDRAYVRCLSGFALLYEHPERSDEGRRRLGEAYEDEAADGMVRIWSQVGYALGSVALGDIDGCRRAAETVLELGRECGALWWREPALRYLAHADWQLGQPEAAEAALREAVRIDRELDDLWHLAWSMEALAWLTVDTGRPERGARLLGIAAGLWAQTGSRLAPLWQPWQTRAIERLQGQLGSRRLEREREIGRTLTRADAYAFALDEPASRPQEPGLGLSPLSPRELEIVALVADGLSNPAIAERLFLSPRTVEKHVEHVMDKLDIGSRAGIAAWHARQAQPTAR